MSADTDRLAAVQAARDAGVLQVRHGDTSTTFRSLAEMDRVINDLRRRTGATKGHQRVRYISQRGKAL